MYTSYASMMAKVHLVFFLSLQSSRFPLTSSGTWKLTLNNWPGTWVMAWAPGFAQFTCSAGNISKPFYHHPVKTMLCRNSGVWCLGSHDTSQPASQGSGVHIILEFSLNAQNMPNSSTMSVGEGNSVHLKTGLETRGNN